MLRSIKWVSTVVSLWKYMHIYIREISRKELQSIQLYWEIYTIILGKSVHTTKIFPINMIEKIYISHIYRYVQNFNPIN